MYKRKLPYVIIAVLLGLLLLVPSCRNGYDALWVLADLGNADLPVPDTRPRVTRRSLSYSTAGTVHRGDIYRPGGRVQAGLVLVPGAAPAGRDDPRLVAFASTLGRAGFLVLVPDIESLRELRPSPEAIGTIHAAADYLRGDIGAARVGIGAFSVAVGPAVLAAMEVERSGRLDFLLLVGGYHDLIDTLTYLTTGQYGGGEAKKNRPNAYGKWVYALSNARRLRDPDERAALSALARRKIDDPAAPVDDLLAGLGPAAWAVYDLISNRDPQRVSTLLNRLPAEVRAEIGQLNLAERDLSRIDGQCILVHGLDDDVIPHEESEALARALSGCKVRLFLLSGLHHVDQELAGVDAWRFWRAVKAVLAQRG